MLLACLMVQGRLFWQEALSRRGDVSAKQINNVEASFFPWMIWTEPHCSCAF